MNIFLTGTAIVVIINALVCLYRVIEAPTIQDRVLAINIVGSKTLVILVLMAFIFKSPIYLDIAMLLVLLNFIVTIVISRYLEAYGRESNQIDS